MFEQIIQIGGVCLSFVGTIISSIIAIRNQKKTKISNNEKGKLEKILEVAKIVKKIPELINEAEKMFPSNGEVKFGAQKLAYVLKEIQIECIQKNIEYDKEAYTFEIEKILETPQKGENYEKA